MQVINDQGLKPVLPGMEQIAKDAIYIYSKLSLAPGEVLVIKIAQHMAHHAKDIKQVFDNVFGRDNDKIILFVDGDISITKIKI